QLQHHRGVLAAAHEDDAGHHVVVGVLAGDALPRHRAYRHLGKALHQDRRAAALGDHDVLDVFDALAEAEAGDQILLASLLDVAAAGVGVAALDRLRELREGDLVVAQPREIRAHLVLLHQPPEAYNVRHARHEAQLAAHHPVLVGAQLARPLPLALHAIAVDLADRGGERRELRLHAVRQIDFAQPLLGLLAGVIAPSP